MNKTLLLSAAALTIAALAAGAAMARYRNYTITYYNNAAHTTVVGQEGIGCDNNYYRYGIKTAYASNVQINCDYPVGGDN